MKVECEVTQIQIPTEYGERLFIDGVHALCSKCGHATQSYGRGEKSIKRCLVLLREECPENEANFYVESNEV